METKSTPITTNIMSFKTFRSPDKIDYNEKNKFFISHPNLSKSKFNKCPAPQKRGKDDKVYLEFLNSFQIANSWQEIRTINPDFFDYSSLLMQQKKNDSSKKPLDIKPPSKLKNEEIIRIWDELFYQVAIKKSKIETSQINGFKKRQKYYLLMKEIFDYENCH